MVNEIDLRKQARELAETYEIPVNDDVKFVDADRPEALPPVVQESGRLGEIGRWLVFVAVLSGAITHFYFLPSGKMRISDPSAPQVAAEFDGYARNPQSHPAGERGGNTSFHFIRVHVPDGPQQTTVGEPPIRLDTHVSTTGTSIDERTIYRPSPPFDPHGTGGGGD